MTVRPLTRREHVWVLAAVAVLATLAYGLWRYVPAQQELETLVRQAEDAESSAKALALPAEPLGSIERSEAEKAELELAVAEAQDALTLIERRFVPLDAPDVLYAMRVELSTLARTSGMRIVQHDAYEPREDQPRQGSTGRQTNFLSGRPLRRLEAATSYDGFRRFVRGLRRVSRPVAVVEWTLERADPAKRGPGDEPLIATMILAL